MADENQLLHLENRIQNEYSILEYLDIRGDTAKVVSNIETHNSVRTE